MNKNPNRFDHTPNHDHHSDNHADHYAPEPDDLELAERAGLDPLARATYDELQNKHLEELNFDERAAYQLYRELRQIDSDDEDTVDRFGGDYWGTYSSVNEFTDNWAYHMEPMEAIETLLHELGHLDKHMSLAELALVDRLKNHLEFIFKDGQVTVFTRKPEEEE